MEESHINAGPTYNATNINANPKHTSSKNTFPSTNINNIIVIDDSIDLEDEEENENKIEIVEHDIKLEIQLLDELNPSVKKEFIDGDVLVKKEPEEIVEKSTEQIVNADINIKEEIVEEETTNMEVRKELSTVEKTPQFSVALPEDVPTEVIHTTEITKKDILAFDSFTQTEQRDTLLTIDSFLEANFGGKPSNLSEAITRMGQIDQWVQKLTTYRQNMFNQFSSFEKDHSKDESAGKKRRIEVDIDSLLTDIGQSMASNEENIEEITFNDIDYSYNDEDVIQFEKVDDVIVEMKVSFILQLRIVLYSSDSQTFFDSRRPH